MTSTPATVMVGDDTEFSAAVAELEEARALKREADKLEKAAREKVLGQLTALDTTKAIVASSGAGVSLQTQHRNRVNTKKLEAMFPDVYAAVVEDQTVEVLRLV